MLLAFETADRVDSCATARFQFATRASTTAGSIGRKYALAPNDEGMQHFVVLPTHVTRLRVEAKSATGVCATTTPPAMPTGEPTPLLHSAAASDATGDGRSVAADEVPCDAVWAHAVSAYARRRRTSNAGPRGVSARLPLPPGPAGSREVGILRQEFSLPRGISAGRGRVARP